jgi:hypothetical protein
MKGLGSIDMNVSFVSVEFQCYRILNNKTPLWQFGYDTCKQPSSFTEAQVLNYAMTSSFYILSNALLPSHSILYSMSYIMMK